MKKLLITISIVIAILLAVRAYATPLTDALIKYEQIAENGGWNKVISTTKIQLGDQDSRVISLWSRLYISGDVTEDYSGKFDRALEAAVERFQNRHGLKADGVVGKETIEAMNVPVKDRIEQIKSNIDKIELKDGFIVNIPDFKLYIVENNQIIKTFRVIVGKKKNQTPILAQKIRYIELNPYWNVPHKIAVKEILPIVKKNALYLQNDNMRVFENWSEDAREIDLNSVDWAGLNKYNFHYKFRQDPGEKNALGYIKFVFPNQYGVYLHDTDKPHLFDKEVRAFSHGCIRIEKPLDLALYLLSDDPEWNLEKLNALIKSGKTKIISLLNPINIYTVYWTAWVDQEGIVNFRDDIYGWDKCVN